MSLGHCLLVCATAWCLYFTALVTRAEAPARRVPATRFRCEGRGAGYYADLELGCRVYHMCDGLGRQFSYTCPNMTLFQQRMLICDHWYMVNCSMAEMDYKANLLIGQRDKPFVLDAEMHLRTPRPDILAGPPFNPYFDTLEDDSKKNVHPGNSIVGVADTISSDNNGLDTAKINYRPPTSWSTGKSKRGPNVDSKVTSSVDHLEAASQEPEPIFTAAPVFNFTPNSDDSSVSPPARHLIPPYVKTESPTTVSDDPVFNFIKRFDPSAPDSHKTAMSKSEIIDLNEHLPAGQVSSEEERTPKKLKNSGNNFNDLQTDNDKSFADQTRFDTVNTKSNSQDVNENIYKSIPEPERELLPPKTDSASIPTSTVGPPVYYEWKWAVPAIDLESPKFDNATEVKNTTSVDQAKSAGRNPFESVTRPPVTEPDLNPSNTDYNISSYFIPDYVFPLDSPHPGYENEEAMTSFQVQVARPGRASYGENPQCPQCHPAYLKPGTCEPCIVRR